MCNSRLSAGVLQDVIRKLCIRYAIFPGGTTKKIMKVRMSIEQTLQNMYGWKEWSNLTAAVGRGIAVHGLYLYTNAPDASRTVVAQNLFTTCWDDTGMPEIV